MSRLTDDTELLRIAIREILSSAQAPMTSGQLCKHPEIAALGYTPRQISWQLYLLYRRKKQLFPLARATNPAPGYSRWVWYDPTVVKLASSAPEPAAPAPAPAPAPAAESPDFTFNPIELGGSGARSITLNVSGVTIRIDLNT